ncbi:DNA cytosine methyltransferase [Streptomyces sp. NBC_01751]|uniref:DNA cytosine methyltransferase n=1 Tax=Streptomyces sp. NBC_01751 TaxID=2975929 RepID=UPI002DD8F929|nr:DNA cytosine methyltransferase [Streptomyces sp. NBC_01751]WSD30013.1 DNA cytosine methyltransferase [Streptomyces sp. NBC_01751]
MAVSALTGGRVHWVADNDPNKTLILDRRFPGIQNLGDITQLEWADMADWGVDIITAGFPCQDISNAGKRVGIEGERSGIWANVSEAVRVLRPKLVFLENVGAIRSRGIDRVLGDLAACGYDAQWTCYRASAVGAPHHRDRWFCVASPADSHGC